MPKTLKTRDAAVLAVAALTYSFNRAGTERLTARQALVGARAFVHEVELNMPGIWDEGGEDADL